jgi:hypothetical protein
MSSVWYSCIKWVLFEGGEVLLPSIYCRPFFKKKRVYGIIDRFYEHLKSKSVESQNQLVGLVFLLYECLLQIFAPIT